ncbi:MAG: hypothetical protein LBC35_01155 [Coriobacteriales bacterium]|jgi:hypothetical protein|nr:hypothetical protein [Coriobacteriales bacterium]
MLNQITVFLENDKGRLAGMCRTLGDANISMSALTVADTADYGVARLIANDPNAARDALVTAGYRAKLVEVYAVEIPNVAGSLARLLEAFDAAGINLEYAYCFASNADTAIEVFRVEDGSQIAGITERVGYKLLSAADLSF